MEVWVRGGGGEDELGGLGEGGRGVGDEVFWVGGESGRWEMGDGRWVGEERVGEVVWVGFAAERVGFGGLFEGRR